MYNIHKTISVFFFPFIWLNSLSSQDKNIYKFKGAWVLFVILFGCMMLREREGGREKDTTREPFFPLCNLLFSILGAGH